MYDVYNGTAPSYLRELCHVCNDDRLRSTQRGNFSVVRTRTKLVDGAFTVAGPAVWNVLPSHLRNSASKTVFLSNLKRLKTHLYNRRLTTLWIFKFFRLVVGRNCICIVVVRLYLLRMRGAVASNLIWFDLTFACNGKSRISKRKGSRSSTKGERIQALKASRWIV